MRADGKRCIDMLEAFDEHRERFERFFSLDHYPSLGNEVLARRIHDFLKSSGLSRAEH